MKTLILCVDRDDDLGAKGGVATPVVGRRRTLDAAVALGLADPEDSDTNALLAAVHLYDRELADAQRGGSPVEVAAIAGDKAMGIRADRKMAAELEQVLAAVRPDEVVLVSDGAEDEQILPILQSRAKVVHVHRSVVKQAPRLEGFYYVLTRILDDEKQAKRFVLPFAIILLLWGVAYLVNLQTYAWGATLAVFGFWLLMHAMKWEEKVRQTMSDMGRALRSGKLTLFATLLMLVLLFVGALTAIGAVRDHVLPPNVFVRNSTLLEATVFTQAFLPYLVSALLVRIAGGLFDAWVRLGRAGIGHWTAAFTLIALGLMGTVAADVAVDYLEARDIYHLVTFQRFVQFMAGLVVGMGGILVHRYIRSFSAAARPR